jgi:hypothetical protein
MSPIYVPDMLCMYISFSFYFTCLYLKETCDTDLILYFPEYGAPDVGEYKTQTVTSHTKLISILSKLTPYTRILAYFPHFEKK